MLKPIRVRASDLVNRVVDAFANASSTTASFVYTTLIFTFYMIMGQRLPHLPRLPWFDYYPFPFLVTFVSLWAILLAIAVLKTGKSIEGELFDHLDVIERLDAQIEAMAEAHSTQLITLLRLAEQTESHQRHAALALQKLARDLAAKEGA